MVNCTDKSGGGEQKFCGFIQRQSHPLLAQVEQKQKGPGAFVTVGERVIFDHKVKQVRGALLADLVKRALCSGSLVIEPGCDPSTHWE